MLEEFIKSLDLNFKKHELYTQMKKLVDIPDDIYFKAPFFSASDFNFLKTKGLDNFIAYKKGELPKLETPALTLGSALHCNVLEPHEFQDRFVIVLPEEVPVSEQMKRFCNHVIDHPNTFVDDDSLVEYYSSCYSTRGKDTGKILAAARVLLKNMGTYIEAKKNNVSILSSTDHKRVQEMTQAINFHPFFREWFDRDNANVHFEKVVCDSLETDYGTIYLKGKIDALCVLDDNVIILDLKTTSMNSYHSFTKSIYEYGYAMQSLVYSYLISCLYPDKDIEYYILPVQTATPYGCRDIYNMSITDGVLTKKSQIIVNSLRARLNELFKFNLGYGDYKIHDIVV